jgi:hypothetical protein
MSAVSSTSTAISNLLQTLSGLNSPVLSSPSVQTALESAPPQDIVQISDAAIQLQNTTELFAPTYNPNPASYTYSLQDMLLGIQQPVEAPFTGYPSPQTTLPQAAQAPAASGG